MTTMDIDSGIDLDIAIRKLHQLQLEDGDLGTEYWYEVSMLLQEAALYKARALAAEEKLRRINELSFRV